MNDYNPVTVEQAIRDCSNRISKGVTVCANTYAAFLNADRAYDQAYASEYIRASDKPAHERKYVAELATTGERETRDLADAAYRYSDRQARALESELRAWQSVGASIRSAYAVAGRGES